jgi:translation initiation factor eIF-2B subunit gamma
MLFVLWMLHLHDGQLLQIVSSVVMNHVVIEDGCHVQGSVVCNNVQLQERCVLKDCQVSCTPYRKNR